jgi:hypothetical protein
LLKRWFNSSVAIDGGLTTSVLYYPSSRGKRRELTRIQGITPRRILALQVISFQ